VLIASAEEIYGCTMSRANRHLFPGLRWPSFASSPYPPKRVWATASSASGNDRTRGEEAVVIQPAGYTVRQQVCWCARFMRVNIGGFVAAACPDLRIGICPADWILSWRYRSEFVQKISQHQPASPQLRPSR
jgi:hypothetical protein